MADKGARNPFARVFLFLLELMRCFLPPLSGPEPPP